MLLCEYEIDHLHFSIVCEIVDLVGCIEDDSKVHARAADAPEEVGVLSCGDCYLFACCGNQFHADQAVDDQAVDALVAAHAATKGSAHESDTGA